MTNYNLLISQYEKEGYLNEEQLDKLYFLLEFQNQSHLDEDNFESLFMKVVNFLPPCVYVKNYSALFGVEGAYEYRKKLSTLFNNITDVHILKYFYKFCVEKIKIS